MKTAGIIGGIGPESTIEYYRKIVSAYLRYQKNASYPSVIINSIDLTKMLVLLKTKKFDEVAAFLASEIKKLENAGANFGALASNTPHIVFDQVRELSKLPLISIVESTSKKVIDNGLKRVALFGTKFTMRGGFYTEALSKKGVEVYTPNEKDQQFIHDKYMNELVLGIVRDETRTALIDVIERMRKIYNFQGLILGGTELPLILNAKHLSGIHLFDTTEIHVEAIVKALIQD